MESRWLLSLPNDLERVSDVTAFLVDRLGASGEVPCVKLDGFTLPATEPAQLLIRDGDVLALEWKDVFQMSTSKSSGGYARGDLAARRRLEGAARRAGLADLPEVLLGDEPQLFDDQLLGGWPKAVAAWTAMRQQLIPRAKVAKVVLVKMFSQPGAHGLQTLHPGPGVPSRASQRAVGCLSCGLQIYPTWGNSWSRQRKIQEQTERCVWSAGANFAPVQSDAWQAQSLLERCFPCVGARNSKAGLRHSSRCKGSAIAPQSELHWHADETSSSLELVEENEGSFEAGQLYHDRGGSDETPWRAFPSHWALH